MYNRKKNNSEKIIKVSLFNNTWRLNLEILHKEEADAGPSMVVVTAGGVAISQLRFMASHWSLCLAS